MEIISYRAALRKLIAAGGKIMSATFIKEDGSERLMTFRRETAFGVKGVEKGQKNDKAKRTRRPGVITVLEMTGAEPKWKSINLKTLKELKVDGMRYLVSGSGSN